MQAKNLTLQRLMKEQISLDKEPLSNAIVVRKDILNFHFCLYKLQGPYEGGFYHGVLQLHENYPFAAPKLLFYTPSGRFDINIPICTSFTNYHQETWTSAWNVRTLILATISFMYSEEPSYGCRHDSNQQRIKLAQDSLRYNFNNSQFVELFKQKMLSMGLVSKQKLRQLTNNKQPQPNYVDYLDAERESESKDREEDVESIKSENQKHFGEGGQRRDWWRIGKTVIIIAGVIGLTLFLVHQLS